jgi:hypothetical protein
MISNSVFSKKRRGTMLAGVFSLALSSVLLLCGAGLTPTGSVQTSDINANGFNLTNAATVSATNVVVSGTLTAPSGFTLPLSKVSGSLAGDVSGAPSATTVGKINGTTIPSATSSALANAPNTAGGVATLDSTGAATFKLPVANVKAYGATGNGSTDDTSAINSALAAASAVYFPAGTYVVSNLTANNGNFLFGDGPNSILSFKTGSTGYLIYGNGFGYSARNLTISGGNTSSYVSNGTEGNRSGLHVDSNYPNQSFDNLYFTGFSNICLGLNSTGSPIPGVSVTNCHFLNSYCPWDTGPGGTNQDTANSGVNPSEYDRFSGNMVSNCWYGALVDSGNLTLGSNHIFSCGFGLFVNNASNAAHGSFIGNLVNHCGTAIYATGIGGQTFNITGNFFILSNAITIINSTLHITNNDITQGQWNLSDNASDYLYVVGNRFWSGLPTVINSLSNPYSPANIIWRDNRIDQATVGLSQYAPAPTTLDTVPLLVDGNVTYTPGYTTSGSNLVTNGNFSSSSNWTQYVSGWSISGGFATSSGGSGTMYQPITTTNGLYYLVTYTISSYTGGSVNCDIGFATGGTSPARSANGTYSEIVPSTQGSNLCFYGNNFSGSITNVSALAISASAPGTLNVGSVSASNSVRIGSAHFYSGSGSPNSAQTGNPGDLYLNISGGSATTLYVKESGTGTTTGWVGK